LFALELPVVNDYIDFFLWLQVKAETSVALQAEIQQLHQKYQVFVPILSIT
jgi:hypothetical protein